MPEQKPNQPAHPEPTEKPGVERLACAPKGIEPPRVITSEALFAGSKLVVIDHAGGHYRLMITKNDKLILQK